jgi:hypothetical protein
MAVIAFCFFLIFTGVGFVPGVGGSAGGIVVGIFGIIGLIIAIIGGCLLFCVCCRQPKGAEE